MRWEAQKQGIPKGKKAEVPVDTRTLEEIEEGLIKRVRNLAELDEVISSAANSQPVVLEIADAANKRCQANWDTLTKLAKRYQRIKFVRLLVNYEPEGWEAAVRLGVIDGMDLISRVPAYKIFVDNELEYEQYGLVDEDGHDLMQDLHANVVYHGDHASVSSVKEIHTQEEHKEFLSSSSDDKLAVIEVSVKYCSPCAKVYPTMLSLSKKMEDSAVFARMLGDENQFTRELMKQYNIVEAPTFMFFRGGNEVGRYVGSNGGSLIGEILELQGMDVTNRRRFMETSS
eukprot:jgi/Mesvir1/8409/Mv12648-RA.1